MKFIADLHVHSHFSRATAKNLDLEHLYMAARLKGISLVGTGDFTHPGWIAELEEKLIPAEPGLFKLKRNTEAALDRDIPPLCKKKVRFILQTEISSIYKKNDRVRKNHNLLYFPDFDKVKLFNLRLDRIGNIKSDGRPILGLDAEKLLEIMLETSDKAFFIPAHIWTPWFSMFGSKSGFDSIKECFGSLSDHIFAVETGLSSDPPMNWRVKDLDRVRLVSNSDAHSPGYLGRNASVFNTDLSYDGIRGALEKNDTNRFKGTIDMYPEEGKYHFDGHRKCNICFNPKETIENKGICPECGKPLTLGVLYRVQMLAKRAEGYIPENRQGYRSIIPLNDILSEILDVGPKTKKVAAHYTRAIQSLGSELGILLDKNINDIAKAGIPLLAEAVKRMRNGNVKVSPGFDGEYGKVKIFDDKEKDKLKGEQDIFFIPAKQPKSKGSAQNKVDRTIAVTSRVKIKNAAKDKGRDAAIKTAFPSTAKPSKTKPAITTGEGPAVIKNKKNTKNHKDKLLSCLNREQSQAVLSSGCPVIIEAGPGTGKTRTLTTKIAWLITEKNIRPDSILALTFTNRAAQEMKQRTAELLVSEIKTPVCTATFHSFCLMILKEYASFNSVIADDTTRKELMKMAFDETEYKEQKKKGKTALKKIDHMIAMAKQHCLKPFDNLDSIMGSSPDDGGSVNLSQVWTKYQDLLSFQNAVDFEDLIAMTLDLLKSREDILLKIQKRFSYVFIDEYQDINKGQYLLTKILADKGNHLFVIGDPDQSIYGFRGSDNSYFKQFIKDYPGAEKISLKRNYRSTDTILEASYQMITSQRTAEEKREAEAWNTRKNNQVTGHAIKKPRGQIKRHTKEKIFSDIKGRDRLMIMETASEKAEAVVIGKTIERLMGGISLFSMDAGKADAADNREFSFSDFAVLYRTKNQSAIFEKIFEKAGIPFQTADRDNVLHQKGIKQLLSIAKTILGKGSINDLETALEVFFIPGKNKPGKKTKAILKKWLYSLDTFPGNAVTTLAKNFPLNIKKTYEKSIVSGALALLALGRKIKNKNPADFISIAADTQGIMSVINENEKIKDIFDNLLCEAENFTGTSSEFLEYIALKRDTEAILPGIEKVCLMTMHAAKGLEFPVVFIAGCEKGLVPFTYFDNKKAADTEEERRLFYVAMTRAKKILCLTYAKKRRIYNKIINSEKSPFLNDIEAKLKDHIKDREKKKNSLSDQNGIKTGKQLDLFAKI